MKGPQKQNNMLLSTRAFFENSDLLRQKQP